MSHINLETSVGQNGTELTKLSLAILSKQPTYILEFANISENGESAWTGRDFAPRTPGILNC
jgi:hypothetical protein